MDMKDLRKQTDVYYKGYKDGKAYAVDKIREIFEEAFEEKKCQHEHHCTSECTDCMFNNGDMTDLMCLLIGELE